MKKVRAKFVCNYIEQQSAVKVAHFHAVYDGESNKDFTSLTPGGNLSISITNDAPAGDFFEQGKSYFLDFTEA